MRETKFIEQNKQKWQEFEKMLKTKDKNPNKLSDLFIQITDDLSFARTFYPNRAVRYYLNNLAQQAFYNTYRGKKNGLKNFKKFWGQEVPQVLYESRNSLLLSLIIFVVSAIIGVFSTIQDPGFVKTILGEGYVEMTMENIETGDPMAVYKKMNQVDMFLGITFNNIFIAFKTFVFGIFLAVGTILVMLYNGIMVGTFQYFFIEKGLFWESFLTIWLHGTLEISSIIIAGAAGLKLGSGLIFPGTFSRMRAFRYSGKKGLIILVSIIPILTFAALIESFITRYTETHPLVKGTLILVSLAFIIWYFVLLPRIKAKRGDFRDDKGEKLTPSPKAEIDTKTINSTGEIFSQIFILYRDHLKNLILVSLIASIVYTFIIYFLGNGIDDEAFTTNTWFFIITLFDYKSPFGLLLAFVNFVTIALNLSFVLWFIQKYLDKDAVSIHQFFINHFYKVVIVSAIIQAGLFMHLALIILFMILIVPALLLWVIVMIKEKPGLSNGVKRVSGFFSQFSGRITGTFLLLAVASVLYFFLIKSPFTFLYFEAINWNLNLDMEERQVLFYIFSTITSIFALNMIIPLFIYGFTLQYFSMKEIMDASGLKEKILNFGGKLQ